MKATLDESEIRCVLKPQRRIRTIKFFVHVLNRIRPEHVINYLLSSEPNH